MPPSGFFTSCASWRTICRDSFCPASSWHAAGALERRGATVEIELAARGHRLERPEPDGHAVGQRALAELDELVGADDELGERMADGLALAEPEQVLGRQIEIGDDEVLVEGDDGDAEPAEYLLGARGLADRPAG
jgi:hypothetical protein